MKRALFISTSFNSYYKEIICELKKKGFQVDWYSDRPSESIISRALIRINKKILSAKIKRYEKHILKEACKNKYEIIFVILGQSFDTQFWKKLRETHKESRFIYYTWDSSINFPCIERNIVFFDKAFCFDKRDSQKFDCKFLPLFYIDAFKEKNEKIIFDYSYIGTIKPYRYQAINNIINQLDTHDYHGFKYFYLHSKMVLKYYKHKYNNEFKKVDEKNVKYKYISKNKCAEIESMSKYIIDMPQKEQEGLTIRTFEALGLKRKLITTNKDIVNYDFFNKKNFYIVENDSIDFEDIFFHSEYEELPLNIYSKYSISNWLNSILED